jgi:PAS domain-containing protein
MGRTTKLDLSTEMLNLLNLYRNLLNPSRDSILFLDNNGYFFDANQSSLELLVVSHTEMDG